MERHYSMDSVSSSSTIYSDLMPVTFDRFKNGETLEKESDGPLKVLDSVYIVQEKYKNIETAQAFVEAFEAARNDELDGLRKHFLSYLFFNFKKANDLVSMVTVLKCNDYTIQEEILQHVHSLVFSRSLDTEDETKLLDVLDTLLLILQKRKDYPCLLKKLQPLILDTFSLLMLQTLLARKTTNVCTDLRLKCSSFSKIATKLKNDKNVEEARPVFDILLKFVKSLGESRLKNLGLEKWPNILTNESEAVGWKTKSTEVPLTDLYAMLHVTISQTTQKSNHVAARFLQMFVTDLLRNYVQKQRRNILLQPLISLLTRGIVWILESKVFNSDDHVLYSRMDELRFPTKEEWCFLLDNCKSHLDSRGTLIPTEEIGRMMFRYSSEIPPGSRIAVSLPIEEHYVKHIQWLLPGLHVIVDSTTSGAWCNLPGTMFAEKRVKLHFKMKERMVHETDRTLQDNELDILTQLQTTQTHENVMRLLAHQAYASPKFYIVEYIGNNLHVDLINRRRDLYRKIPIEVLLQKYLLDILMAVEYLHSKQIIVRKIISHSFSVSVRNTGSEKVVLTDFTLAQQLTEASAINLSIRDMDAHSVPTRWTAPESLTEDVYNEQSDVWMVGMIMYELYTLGCQPFTEMRSFSTDAIVNKVFFHSLKTYKWPCIPEDVHIAILRCTKDDPNERHSIKSLLATVKHWVLEPQDSESVCRLHRQSSMESQYPMIDPLQDPPETGITVTLKNLKEKQGMRITYHQMKEKIRTYSGNFEVTEDDITCVDSPDISTKREQLIVKEPVSSSFIEKVLPQMSKDFGNKMLIVKWPNRQARDVTHNNSTRLKHNLVYGFDNGQSLLNKSIRYGNLHDNHDEEILRMVYEIVHLVWRMHSKNWLFRDLCAQNIYIDNHTNKAFYTRISRMVRLGKTSHGVYHDKMFEDRVYWYPREVLMNEDFSKASDVYMLAMVLYELYCTIEIIRRNPRGNILHRVPYADTPKTAILEKIHNGEKLNCPGGCPAWLFQLMVKCWSRDVTKRPVIESVLSTISERLPQQSRPISCSPNRNSEQIMNLNVNMRNICPFSTPKLSFAADDLDIAKENPCYESGSSVKLSTPIRGDQVVAPGDTTPSGSERSISFTECDISYENSSSRASKMSMPETESEISCDNSSVEDMLL